MASVTEDSSGDAVPDILIITRDQLPADTIIELQRAIRAVLMRAAGSTSVPDSEPSTWTVASAASLLERLDEHGHAVRRDAMVVAARTNGFVSRDSIYVLGGYSPDRSLRGWSRPIAREVEALRRKGVVPAGAPVPLVPVYSSARSSYQKAIGFQIPPADLDAFRLAVQGLPTSIGRLDG